MIKQEYQDISRKEDPAVGDGVGVHCVDGWNSLL